jgi:uncharacterized membrane protein
VRVTEPSPQPYNRFSGQSLEHLTALTDGLFAVAMTLLVLDLRVPAAAAYSEHGLWTAVSDLGPSFAAYLLSFTMLGTFWLAAHTLLGILGRCDRTLTWILLGFLFVVSVLPFTAALLAHYVHLRLAVGLYWLNILLLGAALEAAARHGRTAFLGGPDAPGQDAAGRGQDAAGPGDGGAGPAGGGVSPDIALGRARLSVFRRRILIAQGLYALAALICLASTVASVIALALVQLYFIVSPRLPRRGERPAHGGDDG